MSKVPNNELKQKQFKQRQKQLNELLYDDTTMFMLSPVQILIISLIFIGNVFLLHIAAKFVPTSSIPQVSLSLLVVIVSIFVTFMLNK